MMKLILQVVISALLVLQASSEQSAEVTLVDLALDHFEYNVKMIPKLFDDFGFKTTDDVIKFIKSYPSKKVMETKVVVDFLQEPAVRSFIDKTIPHLRELPSLFHGIRIFLEGPDGKPVLDALKEVGKPLVVAAQVFVTDVTTSFHDDWLLVATKELEDLRMRLENPQVIKALVKLAKLPATNKLAGFLREDGADLEDINAIIGI